MIVNISKINERIVVRDDKNKHVQNYDIDNSYPQNILKCIQGSGTTTTSINLFKKFVNGLGFEDKIWSSQIVTFNKHTIEDLLFFVCEDYTRFSGFTLQLNYNANLIISEINHVPFEYARLSLHDDYDYIPFIAICNNWDRKRKKNLSEKDIVYIDVFNINKEIITKQIERDGGIEKYKGQVFWYPTTMQYPLSYIDPILEDVQSDSKIQTFKYKNITTNFMASHMLVTDPFESKQDEQDFFERIKEFQGADNASRLMWLQKRHPEQSVELQKFEIANNDKLFEYTETSVQKNIRKRFGIPTVLAGELTPGKLGATQEVEEATAFYNGVVKQDRIIISRMFKQIFDNSIFKNVNDNYNILPFKWEI